MGKLIAALAKRTTVRILGGETGSIAEAAPGPFQAHVFAHFVEHVEVSGPGFLREGVEQEVVADRIDYTRDTLTTVVDLSEHRWRENRLMGHTCPFQTAINVLDRFAFLEGLKVASEDDSLLELSEIRRVQFPIEFWLPREDNLKKLSPTVLEVAQHADLFEYVPLQIVGFIDDHDRRPARVRLLDQQLIQRE